MPSLSKLHHTVLSKIIQNGHAPDQKRLAEELQCSINEISSSLLELQEYHGIVLHPHNGEIWVAHPFATAPTNFLVTSKRGKWWGNCAWCSLGIAALLDEDVHITTTSGAHGERLDINIKSGQVHEKHLVVHFPVPMKEAWDNVIYTCSTMLVFNSADEVTPWCKQHNIAMGDIQPIGKVWAMSQKWYGKHLDPNWRKWTIDEAKGIFAEFGLTHPIWSLESTGQRF